MAAPPSPWAFWAAAALAVLTKGLIGIVLPALVIGSWIALFRRWGFLRQLFLPSGVMLFLLIAVPWHVLVARANPEFAWFYFVHEHLLRYTTKIHQRFQPFWFFLPVLVAGMLPWTFFLPHAIRGALAAPGEERRQAVFLVLWAGLVFAFFSFSGSKLVPYILPVLPSLALLLGRALAAAREEEKPAGFRNFLPAGMAAASALLLFTVVACLPRFDRKLSVKDLALDLRTRLRPGDVVTTYHEYYQGLPFYLGRTITVAAWRGELDFGMRAEDVSAWMIGEAAFWRLWNGPRTVYLVGDGRFEAPVASGHVRLVARSGPLLLLVNRLDPSRGGHEGFAAAPHPTRSGMETK